MAVSARIPAILALALLCGPAAARAFADAPGPHQPHQPHQAHQSHQPRPATGPRPDLTLHSLPAPTTLVMRARPPRVAQSGDSPAQTPLPNGGGDDAQVDTATRLRRQLRRLVPVPLFADRPLSEQVLFRVSLGVALDGGQPSKNPTLSGNDIDPSYARLRIYSFGDAVLGSRGLLMPSLTTYFAAAFRFEQDPPPLSPVPSVHDARGVQPLLVRSAYAQTDGLFETRWLSPLFVRAGRQYQYGPAVVCFDGLTAGYSSRVLSLSVFGGRGVDLYGVAVTERLTDSGLLGGGDVRVDLFELARIPVVVDGSMLAFDGHSHARGGLALRWSRAFLLGASIRLLDGAVARQRVDVNARISQVTTVSLALDHRTERDWMYDLFTAQPTTGAADSRRYLDLGPPLPRSYLDLRAGTVLLDNVDVLVRAAAAVAHTGGDGPVPVHAPSYLEAGGALEVRLRRALAVGASLLARGYDRQDELVPLIVDTPDLAGPLDVNPTLLGERSFMEGGLSVRFSQGARKLSAAAELYGRAYRGTLVFVRADGQPATEADDPATLGGGRFSVDGWVLARLRVRAEYDVSTRLPSAPELRGIKSLRLLMEGQF